MSASWSSKPVHSAALASTLARTDSSNVVRLTFVPAVSSTLRVGSSALVMSGASTLCRSPFLLKSFVTA